MWAAAAGALMCGKCCGVMVVLAVHHVAIMDGHALLGAGGGHAAVPPFCVICIRRGSHKVEELPLQGKRRSRSSPTYCLPRPTVGVM